jgi:hypothetical protein
MIYVCIRKTRTVWLAYYVNSRDPAHHRKHKQEVYRGDSVIEDFLTRLRKESERTVRKVKSIKIPDTSTKKHAKATNCVVCSFISGQTKVLITTTRQKFTDRLNTRSVTYSPALRCESKRS